MEERAAATRLVDMYSHPEYARFLANDRQAGFLREAEHARLVRDARGGVSRQSRLRDVLSRVQAARLRVFRPARAS